MSFVRLIKNRYAIGKDPMAFGGYGKVYLAKDKLKENTEVALKEIDATRIIQSTATPDVIEGVFKIAQEAINLVKFNHENIIKYIDCFCENKIYFYIITEFCDQKSLFDAIIKPKIEKEEATIMMWLSQSVHALKYIHDEHIYHRDIKPQNIFLKDNSIKLGDFGISISVSGTIYALSSFGTEFFRAPEIIDAKEYDSKSDIWALGATFYEVSCFKRPFRSEADIIRNTKIDIITKYSTELNDILRKMMLYEPSERINAENLIKIIYNMHSNLKDKKPTNDNASKEQNVKISNNLERKTFILTNELKSWINDGNFYKINLNHFDKILKAGELDWKNEIKGNMKRMMKKTDFNELFKNLDENKLPHHVFTNQEKYKNVISQYRVGWWFWGFLGLDLHLVWGRTHLVGGGWLVDLGWGGGHWWWFIIWSHENTHLSSEFLVEPGFFIFCRWEDFHDCFEEISD